MFLLYRLRKSPDDGNDTDSLSLSPAGSTSSGESCKRTYQDSPPKFPDINDPSPPPMMGHSGEFSMEYLHSPLKSRDENWAEVTFALNSGTISKDSC